MKNIIKKLLFLLLLLYVPKISTALFDQKIKRELKGFVLPTSFNEKAIQFAHYYGCVDPDSDDQKKIDEEDRRALNFFLMNQVNNRIVDPTNKCCLSETFSDCTYNDTIKNPRLREIFVVKHVNSFCNLQSLLSQEEKKAIENELQQHLNAADVVSVVVDYLGANINVTFSAVKRALEKEKKSVVMPSYPFDSFNYQESQKKELAELRQKFCKWAEKNLCSVFFQNKQCCQLYLDSVQQVNSNCGQFLSLYRAWNFLSSSEMIKLVDKVESETADEA